MGIKADSAGYVQENRVEFHVIDRSPIDEAVKSGKLVIPDCVDILTVEGLAALD